MIDKEKKPSQGAFALYCDSGNEGKELAVL